MVSNDSIVFCSQAMFFSETRFLVLYVSERGLEALNLPLTTYHMGSWPDPISP